MPSPRTGPAVPLVDHRSDESFDLAPTDVHSPVPTVSDDSRVRIEVLGKSRIVIDEETHPFPTGDAGRLLQALAIAPNRFVSEEQLGRDLWPDAVPSQVSARLHATVASLRREMGNLPIDTAPGGFRLRAGPDTLDLLEFHALTATTADHETRAVDAALELWRGEPLADFRPSAHVSQLRRQLERLKRELHRYDTAGPSPARPLANPAQPGHSLPRRRLIDLLPSPGQTRLIVLHAPTGHGKTVLARQWADLPGHRVAWCQLTDTDNDRLSFWHGVARSLDLENVGLVTDIAPVITHITNTLTERSAHQGLVLDGFDLIHNRDIHRDLHRFLGDAPEGATVAVTTRRPLPFSSARLQASGQLFKLSAEELRFSERETAQIHSRHDARWIEADRVRLIHTSTGGWPQAVAYAAATLEPTDELATLAPTMGVLVDHVLSTIPHDHAAFVQQTAVMDILSNETCDALTNRTNSTQLLADLADDYGLAEPVPGGYRLNSLVRTVLLERIGPLAAPTHRELAVWLLDNGKPIASYGHAQLAADADLANLAFISALRSAVRIAHGEQLLSWMADPPPSGSVRTRQRAHLAATTLGRRRSDLWLIDHGHHTAPTLHALTKAIDDVHAGRLDGAQAALAEVETQRRQRRALPRGLGKAVRALESIVDFEICLLRGDSPQADDLPALDLGRWPVIDLWAIGQRALLAFTHGDSLSTAALLDLAETVCRGLDPSWPLVADGSLNVVEALTGTGPQSADQRIATLGEVVDRSDASGREVRACIARYALAALLLSQEHPDSAQANRRAADQFAMDHPELRFLAMFRRRLGLDSLSPLDPILALTARELRVLAAMDSDLDRTEIAAELFVSVHTVKTHIRSIYRKLGVHTRGEAVALLRRSHGETPS